MKLSYKNMAALDLKSALSAAHDEKTYRGQCQAMAWIARNVRDQKHMRPTAEAAATAAAQDEDLYNAVFPVAWPIRALLERGEPKAARQMLSHVLNKAKSVTPAASQSEAVFLLFQASMHETERMWDEPFQMLLDRDLPLDHWRHRRNVRDAICMVASVDFHMAKQAATALTDERLMANVLELLNANKKQTPRPFFW